MEPEKLKGNDLKPCRENLDVSNRYVHLHSIPRLSVEKRTFIRIGYRIHRVVLRFNGRRGGTATGLFTETRYSRFFVRLKHGNIGIVPFGDGGNNN